MRFAVHAVHAEYLRLQTHTQNMQYQLLFSRQQWLHVRTSMLRYTYIAFFVHYIL